MRGELSIDFDSSRRNNRSYSMMIGRMSFVFVCDNVVSWHLVITARRVGELLIL